MSKKDFDTTKSTHKVLIEHNSNLPSLKSVTNKIKNSFPKHKIPMFKKKIYFGVIILIGLLFFRALVFKPLVKSFTEQNNSFDDQNTSNNNAGRTNDRFRLFGQNTPFVSSQTVGTSNSNLVSNQSTKVEITNGQENEPQNLILDLILGSGLSGFFDDGSLSIFFSNDGINSDFLAGGIPANKINTTDITKLGKIVEGEWDADDIDISDNTNLELGSFLAFDDDKINVEDVFLQNNGDTGTGDYVFSGTLDLTNTVLSGATPLIFEGLTANDSEIAFAVPDVVSDIVVTLPSTSGELSTLGDTIDLASEITGTLPVASGGTGSTTLGSNQLLLGNGTSAITSLAGGSSGDLLVLNSSSVPSFVSLSGDALLSSTGVLSIASNAVALGTDTTGNYVQSISAGSGLTGDTASEGGVASLAVGSGDGISVSADSITLDIVTTGTSGTSSSNSGLELSSDGLRMIGGCGLAELLKWDSVGEVWECGIDLTVSDANFKENVNSYAITKDILMKLNPVTFDWNIREGSSTGFIAQQVEYLIPNAVVTDKHGYKSIDYSAIIAAAISGIQNNSKRIDTIEQQNIQTGNVNKVKLNQVNIVYFDKSYAEVPVITTSYVGMEAVTISIIEKNINGFVFKVFSESIDLSGSVDWIAIQ